MAAGLAKMSSTVCFVTPGAPVSSVRASSFAPQRTVCHARVTTLGPSRRQRVAPSMGLFGLGLPEIAVIAGIGILIFGPGKIAEMGKDLGGVAGSVKKASSEFQEAMSDSLADADREIEERKKQKGTVVDAKEIADDSSVPMKKVEVLED